ncbi:MAG: hypothetical protein CSA81_07675 [Acidobacteria bacterium]|nr:MAG: hypothetical protein CSA81_07675 [Acidobacteriota bacterium]
MFKNAIILSLFFMGLYVFCQQRSFSPPSGVPSQEYARIAESVAFGELIEQVLLEPNAQNIEKLCQNLVDDSKPIPALIIAEQFLAILQKSGHKHDRSLEKKNTSDLIKRIKKRIEDLDSKFQGYRAAVQKGDIKSNINMAFILYHSGFNRKAIELLDRVKVETNEDIGCNRVKQAFFAENRLNSQAFLIVKHDYDQALKAKDAPLARAKGSQLCYLGIYGESPLEDLLLYDQVFPGDIETEILVLFSKISIYHKKPSRFFVNIN